MKKILFTLCLCSFMVASHAQTSKNNDEYRGIEYYEKLELTPDQKSKIKQLNREMGREFAAIGKDRSISGYEKGEKKRALAIKKREAIYKILTEKQIGIWEDGVNANSPATYSDRMSLRKSISDKYDNSLDRLESKYKADKDKIKNNPNLSKEERKTQEKALKKAYKAEKEKMKREKSEVKSNL